MNEDTTATNSICHLIRRIFRSGKQKLLYSRQAELESAYKTIRMAENYGDSYEAIANRIRTESARYKAFKQNPQPIARITINIKRLDSNEFSHHEYEIRQPPERQDNKGQVFLILMNDHITLCWSLSYTTKTTCLCFQLPEPTATGLVIRSLTLETTIVSSTSRWSKTRTQATSRSMPALKRDKPADAPATMPDCYTSAPRSRIKPSRLSSSSARSSYDISANASKDNWRHNWSDEIRLLVKTY
jgi:hypothetical protein